MVNKEEEDPVGSYFLDLWKSRLSKDDVFNNDDNEETEEVGPTELDTLKSSGGFSTVLPDKLTVKYTHVNLHGHDVGVVQANNPAPVNCLVYYFEIFVKNAGVKGNVSIGFTTQGFNLRRQPGYILFLLFFL